MTSMGDEVERIRTGCWKDDLATPDPYDVWKSALGWRVKDLYNRIPMLGVGPAALLTLADHFARPLMTPFYRHQEYPMVRAFSALALLNLSSLPGGDADRVWARRHLDWLVEHTCAGYSGACWGIGFRYAVAKGLIYDPGMPMASNTPYALEALVTWDTLTGEDRYGATIRSVKDYLDRDLHVMFDDGCRMATSYGPLPDRIVTNSVAYTMFAYSMLLPWVEAHDQGRVRERIAKLGAFVLSHQREDGAWYYAPQEGSFIDCFHSAIVLKNLHKTDHRVGLPGAQEAVERGYAYLKKTLLDRERGLFRRFAVSKRPGLVAFDLYDNAEMLNLAVLMKDAPLVADLRESIQRTFLRGGLVYSQLDRLGRLRLPGTLRWAQMPYLFSLSAALVRDAQVQAGG